MTLTSKWKLGTKCAGIIVLGLVILIILINLQLIYSTIKFTIMIEKISVPSIPNSSLPLMSKTNYLDELKHVAHFVLSRPPQERRQIISLYNWYVNRNLDFRQYSNVQQYYRRIFKLFLLQRLLFKVPESYPLGDARGFVYWENSSEANLGNAYNLLWPLGYDEDGNLVIKSLPGGFRDFYDASAEYDYFFSHFSFRSLDELK
jgi:hypothetical protein